MAKASSTVQAISSPASTETASITLGTYAHQIIGQQYAQILQQEKGVLADEDPEFLHQMRVGSRRLRTALRVFSPVVQLPKACQEKQVRSLTKALGMLRDLDVQIEAMRADYQTRLAQQHHKHLSRALKVLEEQRSQALIAVRQHLNKPSYQKLKAGYEDWLQMPRYRALAELPLEMVLPDLLSPLLSALLLHSAWLIPVTDVSDTSQKTLHDLRKTCKYVRYQADFFKDFYGKPFQSWVRELKEIQENLGTVQDACVLLQLLMQEVSDEAALAEFQQMIQADQATAMKNWETLRHQYLNPKFRRQLHLMLLKPLDRSSKSRVLA